jgi:hypothetical protein
MDMLINRHFFKFKDGSKLTPLLNAIEYGKNETAKNLIFRGADIHTSGKVINFINVIYFWFLFMKLTSNSSAML